MRKRKMSHHQRCAACIYQQESCGADCPMVRYFPADRAQQFLDVHRLFGVKNLMKLRNEVPPEHRDDAVKWMTFEALVWRKDPVHGCLGFIRRLNAKIDATSMDLDATLKQIAFHRTRLEEELSMQQVQSGGFPPPPLPLPPPLEEELSMQQIQSGGFQPPPLPLPQEFLMKLMELEKMFLADD